MNQTVRVVIFLSIVAVLAGLLWYYIQNRIDKNFMETYNEIENMFYEWDSNNLNGGWNVKWIENNGSNTVENNGSNKIISKWIISYDTKANITYIDTEWEEFKGIWTITYSDQEWNSITMLDRNLWAIKSWTWEDRKSMTTVTKRYQLWLY